ncbi:MAG TPA: hypothetical protein PK336_05650 [Methanoculleus sp.]|nr:hypothetical protein [Methanoculleus sp.]
MARYPGLSPHTARPLWRGREEARNAPGGGGIDCRMERDVFGEMQETGAVEAARCKPFSQRFRRATSATRSADHYP